MAYFEIGTSQVPFVHIRETGARESPPMTASASGRPRLRDIVRGHRSAVRLAVKNWTGGCRKPKKVSYLLMGAA